MKKALALAVLLALAAGTLLGVRTIDRIALAFLTGQRRVPGQGVWGEAIASGGPVPGVAFFGLTRPSENPPGFQIVRPWATAREIGLSRGDVVTAVDGRCFRSSKALMTHLVSHYTAGDRVTVTVVTEGSPPRELTMKLRAFVRHPGDLELSYEDVEFRSGSGYSLRGWFIPPPERSDGRVGVFVHGANASRFQALEHGAKYWYHRGYGLLTMDLSGRGTSEGEYITYTVNERKDVVSMLDWARQRVGGDPARVVLFGTSNGAAASIYAASGDPDLPALVLDAPYADLWDALGSTLRATGGYSILRYPLLLDVRWRTGIDLSAVRPVDVIDQVRAPVLFVHGDSDRQVPLSHSERMHEARKRAGLPSELWILPGGEHGFEHYPPEGIFWNRILDFFDRALGGPPPQWELAS